MKTALLRVANSAALAARAARPLPGGATVRVLVAAACLLGALPALSSEYTVSPMRLELDRDARSTVLTLTNTGTDRIDFQLKVLEWTQDAQGKDKYSDTAEIVFFPKILSLDPNETRVVRVGIKSVPASTERTFRLFIEKIPAPNPEPLPPGAHVSVNVRFALPIFVKPPAHEAKGEIGAFAVTGGELVLVLTNTGNEHLRMDEGIALTGRDANTNIVFTKKLEDRYLLAGTTKRLVTTIPRETCAQIATLEVTAKAEQFTLSRTLDVGRKSCE